MTMAKEHAVDMPISESVYNCLAKGVSIEDAIETMLERPLRTESV